MFVRRSRPFLLVVAWIILAGAAAALLSGFFLQLDTLGAHDWDQMESHRYFVVKSIRDFGQFPFWDPYGCGGFAAWGGPEAATIVVSPLLPVYLTLPFADAVRVEIVTLVVLLVAGTWFFARGYVTNPLGLAFVCLAGALNSRLAMQVAVGHSWHLYYAGMPWVLGAFDRALSSTGPLFPSGPDWRTGGHRLGRWVLPSMPAMRWGWLAFGASVFALMVYEGGIYPVPHTALCLAGLAAYRARADRSVRPLVAFAAIVFWGSTLAAPKLFPIAETMARFPRLTVSRETIEPRLWLAMFASTVDRFPGGRVPGRDYLWHEYGQYVGILPLGVILWANLGKLPSDTPLRSLRFVGWSLMLLALGGWGPWVVLHLIPPFRSQHVPTRFTYPAFLLMSVVAAHVVERRAGGWRARWSANAFDATVVFLLTASAASIGLEDARSVRPWFSLRVPPVTERTDGFRQYAEVPPELSYGDGDHNSAGGINGAPGLLVRQANVGAMRCSTAPGLTHDAHLGPDGRPIHMGARGLGDPLYRGEFWADNGRVTLVRWSPDEVVLAVEGAKPGDEIMLNQNWAAGWSANDEPTINRSDINAHRLKEGTETVTFRYRPRTLPAALGFFAVGALGWPAAWLLWSRRRRTPRRPGRDDRWPLDLLRAALGRRRAFRGPDAAIPT